MSRRFRKLDALLSLAEKSIALIDRCRPVNANVESMRLEASCRAGQPQNPNWIYAYPPDLGRLRAELSGIAHELDTGDEVDALYAARARELELEARVAEAIGSPRLRELALQRYGVQRGAEQIRLLAVKWAQLRLKAPSPERFMSDDRRSERSLLSQMLSAVRQMKLPIAVVIKEDLQSVAATGDDTVFLKPRVLLTRRQARRIVVHELLGHVLPRLNARSSQLGLLRVGSASAADDEEGRALLLERRFGLLGYERQVDLGQRHLAAQSVQNGADCVETLRLLLDYGAECARAVHVACRVHRGGGLAREVVYLPCMIRVEQAFSERPELDGWLAAGRLGVDAASRLSEVKPELLSSQLAGAGSAFEFHE